VLEVTVELSADRDYAHKPNPDGSLESICLYCFRTIATGQSAGAMEQLEEQHSCPKKKTGEGNPLKVQKHNGG